MKIYEKTVWFPYIYLGFSTTEVGNGHSLTHKTDTQIHIVYQPSPQPFQDVNSRSF